jgi:hypothetical protein
LRLSDFDSDGTEQIEVGERIVVSGEFYLFEDAEIKFVALTTLSG